MLSTPLPIAYAAAVEGYGMALAREADAGAVERLMRASYDPKEASRAFGHLRHAARAGGAIERFFYGNETVLAERLAQMQSRLKTIRDELAALRPKIGQQDSELGKLNTEINLLEALVKVKGNLPGGSNPSPKKAEAPSSPAAKSAPTASQPWSPKA